MYMYMHTYMYTYIHTHIHTYAHTHIHTYTHAHIHTCTHSQPDKMILNLMRPLALWGSLKALILVLPAEMRSESEVCLFVVYFSVCLSTCLSTCLSACLPLCLSLSICFFVCLCVHMLGVGTGNGVPNTRHSSIILIGRSSAIEMCKSTTRMPLEC